jgi:hypothetical protein
LYLGLPPDQLLHLTSSALALVASVADALSRKVVLSPALVTATNALADRLPTDEELPPQIIHFRTVSSAMSR